MKDRILAFLIDHIIGTIIFGIVFVLINLNSFIAPTNENINSRFESFNFVLAIGMIFYFLRDVFEGRSPGKRVLGIAVRGKEDSDRVPGKFHLILRNITLIIWPIELIILVIKGQRIGEMISKTQIKSISKANHQ
ncbi:RDD family protein [Cohnella sp. GCM10027633]|uniref:RDD family protein n=1 Tax=unclassified Cohnella TaxID=2636738 RepID=UPI00362B6E6A